jgi:protein-tyrosine phosphatase
MLSFFSNLSSKTTNDFSFIGTDIHSHLIPNIDDGCTNLENSLMCIENLKAMGFNKIVTTPHIMAGVYPNTPEIINEGLKILRIALQERNIAIEIEAAAEYKVDELFMEYLEADNLLTFGDNYVLIELSFVAPPVNLEEVIFTMRTKGYKPILAHPERYRYWNDKFHQLEHLSALGCLLQLNLMSLVGQYGTPAKTVAHKLLGKNMIDFLGTDLHRFEDIHTLQKLLKSKDEFKKISQLTPLNKSIT